MLSRSVRKDSDSLLTGDHVEFHSIITEAEDSEEVRALLRYLPFTLFLILASIAIHFLHLKILPKLSLVLAVIGIGLTAYCILKKETRKDEFVSFETVKSYMMGEGTVREKILLDSKFSTLKTVNTLFYKLRAACNTSICVSNFITIQFSLLYSQAVNLWLQFLSRFSEFTYAVLIVPIEGATLNEESKRTLASYLKVLEKTDAVIPIEMRKIVGDPETTRKRFEEFVSKPLDMWAKVNILYSHVRREAKGKFVYLCYACVDLANPEVTKTDVFKKALNSTLADFDHDSVERVICIPAGSNATISESVRYDADMYQEELQEEFGVKTEVLESLVFDNDPQNRVHVTFAFIATSSPQLDEWKKNLDLKGGDGEE